MLIVLTMLQVLEYEYEPEMEDTYRNSMLKTFKKTLDDGFFPFIILDAINEKVKYFDQFWSAAKTKGFEVSHWSLTHSCLSSIKKLSVSNCITTYLSPVPQVYVAEVSADHQTCAKRNIHGRKLKDITKVFIYSLHSFYSWEGVCKEHRGSCRNIVVKIRQLGYKEGSQGAN